MLKLAVAPLVVALLAAVPAGAQAPAAGRLVYVHESNPEAEKAARNRVELRVARADGAGAKAIVTVPKGDWIGYATPSPDGSRIAYLHVHHAGEPKRWAADIRTAAIGGGAPRVVVRTRLYVTGVGWTPDGGTVLFGGAPQSARRATYSDLYAAPAAGGGTKRLTNTPKIDEYSPSAGPGGTILYVRDDGGKTHGDLWLANADGSGQHAIEAGLENVSSARLSPDGTRIVYDASPDNEFESVALRTIGVDGTNPLELTVQSYGDFDVTPGWSADGTRVVFVSNRAGRTSRGRPLYDAYSIPAAGGRPAPLVRARGTAGVSTPHGIR